MGTQTGNPSFKFDSWFEERDRNFLASDVQKSIMFDHKWWSAMVSYHRYLNAIPFFNHGFYSDFNQNYFVETSDKRTYSYISSSSILMKRLSDFRSILLLWYNEGMDINTYLFTTTVGSFNEI